MKHRRVGDFICILIFISLVFVPIRTAGAQPDYTNGPETPETFEQGTNIILTVVQAVPQAIGEIWTNRAVPVWKSLFEKTRAVFTEQIAGTLQSFWQQLKTIVLQEAKEKQPDLKEQFQKEKEQLESELEQRAKETTDSFWDALWNRFMEVIRF